MSVEHSKNHGSWFMNSSRVLPASYVVYQLQTIETCGLLLKYRIYNSGEIFGFCNGSLFCPLPKYQSDPTLAKNGNTSATADHVKTTGHNINWDHFDILAKGKTDYHCKIKKTLLIGVSLPRLAIPRRRTTRTVNLIVLDLK